MDRQKLRNSKNIARRILLTALLAFTSFGVFFLTEKVLAASAVPQCCAQFKWDGVAGQCSGVNAREKISTAIQNSTECDYDISNCPTINSAVDDVESNPSGAGAFADEVGFGRPGMQVCNIHVQRIAPCFSIAKCREKLAATKCTDIKEYEACVGIDRERKSCFWYGESEESGQCLGKFDRSSCGFIKDPNLCGQPNGMGADPSICAWVNGRGCLTAEEAKLGSEYNAPSNGLLPKCAYQGNCRSVNDLMAVPLQVISFLFKFIGSVSLLMFVYGGVMMILSFGNSERVKKGGDILKAAIIGLVIAFGAYILVEYVITSIGITAELNPF